MELLGTFYYGELYTVFILLFAIFGAWFVKILKLNFPNFQSQNLLETKRSWANRLTFGLLGDEDIPPPIKED